MFKNHLKTALRIFKKNKVTTVINVLGLSVGISAAIVIFLMVQYDYSFDKWEPQANNIYEVTSKYPFAYASAVPSPAVEFIKKQITGIETTSYFLDFSSMDFSVTISPGNNKKRQHF